MPTRKRAAGPSWLLDTRVCAFAYDNTNHNQTYDICGRFDLSIRHDEPRGQGMIKLSLSIPLEGFDEAQPFSLMVGPECLALGGISLEPSTVMLSPTKLAMFCNDAPATTDILVLSITLQSPGSAVGLKTQPITPRESSKPLLLSFVKFCDATRIHLYLSKTQIQQEKLLRLKNFIALLHRQGLSSCPIDLHRWRGPPLQVMNRDTLKSLSVEAPPPYPNPSPGTKAGFKRSPDASSAVFKRLRVESPQPLSQPPPPWSPTEVNTPSTRDISDSEKSVLRDNSQANLSRRRLTTASPFLGRVENVAATAPRNMLRDELSRVLPDILKTVLPDVMESVLPGVLRSALHDAMGNVLPSVVRDAMAKDSPRPKTSLVDTETMKSTIDRRCGAQLESLLDTKLPSMITPALEGAMERFLENVENGHALANAETWEEVEDAKTELHATRDDSINEIQKATRDNIDMFNSKIQEFWDENVELLNAAEAEPKLLQTRDDCIAEMERAAAMATQILADEGERFQDRYRELQEEMDDTALHYHMIREEYIIRLESETNKRLNALSVKVREMQDKARDEGQGRFQKQNGPNQNGRQRRRCETVRARSV